MNKDTENPTASLRGSRLTKEEFVEKAKKIHGDLYDYSESVYVNYKTKLKIKCIKHQKEFSNTPERHLTNKSKSCSLCVKRGNKKLTKDEFIASAKLTHGEEYDYSLVEYKSSKTKVSILHKKCGNVFKQTPDSHKRGTKCTFCFRNERKTTEDFIIKAKQKYPNNEFSYENTIYFSSKKKLQIKCNVCETTFMQIAKDHFRFGCPTCGETTKVSKLETAWLNQFNILKKYRQFVIKTNEIVKNGIRKQWFNVDGFDPETNTVYEFLGDFWHGNLEKFSSEKINPRTKTTFKELNEKTFNKINVLKTLGYNVVYILENDYKAQQKQLNLESKIK